MRLEPTRFAFVVNLSGYATPGDLPGDAELAELRPPVFWGRGTRDDVIPEFARDAHDTVAPGALHAQRPVYQGLTHSVSEQELVDVRTFLEKQLATLAESLMGSWGTGRRS